MPTDTKRRPAMAEGATSLKTVRIPDADWTRFVAGCERLKLPIGETAGEVLAWWASLSHEGRQLFAGVLTPERAAIAAEQVKRDLSRRHGPRR